MGRFILGYLCPCDIVKYAIFSHKYLQVSSEDGYKITLYCSIFFDDIWRIRNHIIFENYSSNPRKNVDVINRAYSKHIAMWTSHLACPTLKWFPPEPGWIKINFDVAIIPHAPILAVVGRSEFGDILFAHSNLFLPSNLTLGETQAAFKALKLAVFYNYSYVIFEGECKGLLMLCRTLTCLLLGFLSFISQMSKLL